MTIPQVTQAAQEVGRRSAIFLPAVGAAAAGSRFNFSQLNLTVALLVAVVLLPVWWSSLARYRFVRPLMLIGVGAVLWGAALTVTNPLHETSMDLLAIQSMPVLGMIASLGLLLWARSEIGTSWTVVAFTVGMFATLVVSGPNPINPWKFSYSYPVAFLLLAFAMRAGRWWELLILVGIAGVSAVSDSRSFTAMLLLAAMLVVLQMRRGGATRPKPFQFLFGLAALAGAVYALVQALLLDGILGQGAAERTEAQIASSGSVITGGRPEIGAAFALIREHPFGLGSGVKPRSDDILAAKEGMSALGYDPNNGYVEHFMFGNGVEVHSVLGSLWIRFGPLGAVFALGTIVLAIYTLAIRVSVRKASAIAGLLVTLGAWDTFFSPFQTSYNTIALMLAVVLLAAVPKPAPHAPPPLTRT